MVAPRVASSVVARSSVHVSWPEQLTGRPWTCWRTIIPQRSQSCSYPGHHPPVPNPAPLSPLPQPRPATSTRNCCCRCWTLSHGEKWNWGRFCTCIERYAMKNFQAKQGLIGDGGKYFSRMFFFFKYIFHIFLKRWPYSSHLYLTKSAVVTYAMMVYLLQSLFLLNAIICLWSDKMMLYVMPYLPCWMMSLDDFIWRPHWCLLNALYSSTLIVQWCLLDTSYGATLMLQWCLDASYGSTLIVQWCLDASYGSTLIVQWCILHATCDPTLVLW